MESAIPRRIESFWMVTPGGTHDKVYRLEIQEFKGLCDVIGAYARRKQPLKVHILSEGTEFYDAKQAFEKKKAELEKKGYVRVNEDVSTTSELTFQKVFTWA